MKLEISPEQCWIATAPVDFRRGIDGLCQIVMSNFGKQPKEGVFVFYSKDRKKLKVLGWHRNGFVMIYKRLAESRLRYILDDDEQHIIIDKEQLSWLLVGLDWQAMSDHPDLDYKNYF
jgi:hypothetical protein